MESENPQPTNNESITGQIIGAICNSQNEPDKQPEPISGSGIDTGQHMTNITNEDTCTHKLTDTQIDIISEYLDQNELANQDVIQTFLNNKSGTEIAENDSKSAAQMANVIVDDSTNIIIPVKSTATLLPDSVASDSIHNESEITPSVTSNKELVPNEENILNQSNDTSDKDILIVIPPCTNNRETPESISNETKQKTVSSVISQMSPVIDNELEITPSVTINEEPVPNEGNILNQSNNTLHKDIHIVIPPSSNNQESPEPISNKAIQETVNTNLKETLELISNEATQETVPSVISQISPITDNSLPSTSKGYNQNQFETLKTSDPNDLLLEVPSKTVTSTLDMPNVNIYTEDNGPRIYNVTDNLVSKPIIPTKLVEAFSALPIFGRPKNKSMLAKFQDDKIREFVGIGLDDSEFERLADYCSPDNLRTGNELVMNMNPCQGFYPSEVEKLSKDTENLTTEHDLFLVRKHKLRVEKDTKNLYCKRLKYRGIRMMSLGNEEDDNTPVVTLGTTPVQPGRDLLYVIRWYRPFPYNPRDRSQVRTRHSVFSNNVVMLGRQKLSVLRDRVVCANDVDMRVDVADRPLDLPLSSSKEMFPSGFLFINNVFYVDRRPGCVDYSLPLRKWARARDIGEFQARDMCDVTLDQLPVRLGHPEVYVHQGNCEHLFTISEVRLVHASDPLKLSSYPTHTALSQNQTIYCTTCAEFGAKWIVVGCDRVPFDPAFFCEKCFKLYLYKDGQKVGDFKAYLYRGNEINILKPSQV